MGPCSANLLHPSKEVALCLYYAYRCNSTQPPTCHVLLPAAGFEATLEAPPRVLSPTFPSDYTGMKLPSNKKSLALERKKRGEGQSADHGEEE